MPSRLSDTVFREPAGRRDTLTLAMFGGAAAFAGQYVYFGLVSGNSPGWLLVMMVGFALSGSAESLPTNRHRTAGILRLTSILVFTLLFCVAILAPGLIFG